MKKLLTLIVILLVIAGIWYAVHKHSSVSVTEPASTSASETPSSNHPDPSNATFTFDDGPVALRNGTNSTPVDPSSAIQNETDLTDTVGYGDINNDGKEDAVLVLSQQGGGSGVFLYVAAYVSGNVSYKGTNAVFVGDRIEPESITIKNGIITFSYLDRGPNDPMSADPTIPTTKTYTYQNGELVEK